jgi:RHS repeat-associated protein
LVSGGGSVDWVLDPHGEQIVERSYDQNGQKMSDVGFVFLGNRLLARVDGALVGSVISNHIDYPLLVADASGAVMWHAEADAFGEPTSLLAGSDSADPLRRFPGQWEMRHMGAPVVSRIFFNGHRWYQPQYARYSQSDPLGDGAESAYVYAGGNPMRAIDPSGLAFFAQRPLSGSRWFGVVSGGRWGMDSGLDVFNLQVSHEQLFFEDGGDPSNLGLFASGMVIPDPEFPGNATDYHRNSAHFDDCIMRMAASSLLDGGYYNLLGIDLIRIGPRTAPGPKYNCQDWAAEVRSIYYALEQIPEVREQCNCEE